MTDLRVIVHMQPDAVLVERGSTDGMIYCARCQRPTEHYVTCPGDDDDDRKLYASDELAWTTTWRCTRCEALVDLEVDATILAIHAHETMKRWRREAAARPAEVRPAEDLITAGELREVVADLDAEMPVHVIHLGTPGIAPLPIRRAQHLEGPGEVLRLFVGEAPTLPGLLTGG